MSYKFRIGLPATGQRRVTIDRSHKKRKGKKVGGLYLTYFPTLPTLPIVPTHFRHFIAPLPRKEKRTLPQIKSFNPFSAFYERKIKFLFFTLRCQCSHLQWHLIVFKISNSFTFRSETAVFDREKECQQTKQRHTIKTMATPSRSHPRFSHCHSVFK